MTSTILATGLSGTIGRQLVGRVKPLSIRLEGDIALAQDEVRGTTLIHLAAVVGEKRVCANLPWARNINVRAATDLAKAALAAQVDRFVYVSTCHVYDVRSGSELLAETHPTLPRGHYALQKLIAEELICEVFKNDPERLVIARVFSVVDHHQPTGTLGDALCRLASDGQFVMNFVDDVRDFLSPNLIADVLFQIARDDSVFGVINVCSGQAITVRELAALMLPSKTFEKVSRRLLSGHSATPRIVGDPHELNKALGLAPGSLFGRFNQEIQRGKEGLLASRW